MTLPSLQLNVINMIPPKSPINSKYILIPLIVLPISQGLFLSRFNHIIIKPFFFLRLRITKCSLLNQHLSYHHSLCKQIHPLVSTIKSLYLDALASIHFFLFYLIVHIVFSKSLHSLVFKFLLQFFLTRFLIFLLALWLSFHFS